MLFKSIFGHMPSAWQVEDLLPAIWGFAQAASGLGEHTGLVVHP